MYSKALAVTVAAPATEEETLTAHEPSAPVTQLDEDSVPSVVEKETCTPATASDVVAVTVDAEVPSAGTVDGLAVRLREGRASLM